MLTVPTLEMASGLTLTNPVLVVNNLSHSNNTFTTEVLNKSNAVETSSGGSETINFRLTVFLDKTAFDEGKPPIGDLQSGSMVKTYSFDPRQPEYEGMTEREAAYHHAMNNEPQIEGATVVDDISI